MSKGGLGRASDGSVDLTALVGHLLLVVDILEVTDGGVLES